MTTQVAEFAKGLTEGVMSVQPIEYEVTENDDVPDDVEMFGDKEARWYQIAARNLTVKYIVEELARRVLVKQPTGAGKTFTSGLIFSCPKLRAFFNLKGEEKMIILFIAHKHRLLTQAERAYAQASNIELILQSAFSPLPASLFNEDGSPRWHISCIDEAHHEAMMTIQYQLDKIADRPIIGLTATPERADGMLIKFDRIVEPITREQAVKEGWLAPTRLFSFVDAPERDKCEVLKDVFDAYVNIMGQTMVFVRTKMEVAAITKYLKDKGYSAVGILNQSEAELNTVLDMFSNKLIQFVVNCNKINEGVDVRFCESVVLGRTFGSYPQLNQVIGRASRPDSKCQVFELINPLSGTNLDTTVVVGEPEEHLLIYRINGKWVEEKFDYTNGWCPGGLAMDDEASVLRPFGM